MHGTFHSKLYMSGAGTGWWHYAYRYATLSPRGAAPHISQEHSDQIDTHKVQLREGGVDEGERLKDKVAIFDVIKKQHLEELFQSLKWREKMVREMFIDCTDQL